MRISDWSSDVCSSDLVMRRRQAEPVLQEHLSCGGVEQVRAAHDFGDALRGIVDDHGQLVGPGAVRAPQHEIADLCGNVLLHRAVYPVIEADDGTVGNPQPDRGIRAPRAGHARSEEHTSELQSLMRISYAVFCLKKKTKHPDLYTHNDNRP